MRLRQLRLAVCPVLFCYFGLAMAARVENACGSSSFDAESDVISKLEESIQVKKEGLLYKWVMMTLSSRSHGDYVDIKVNHLKILERIDSLKTRFFSALSNSGLYPCFSEEAKAETLAMSLEGFRKDCGERYNTNRHVRNADIYVRRFNQHIDRINKIESKIGNEKIRNQEYRREGNEDGARESDRMLESLDASFNKSVEKMESHLSSRLQRYREIREHYEEAEFLSDKVLGGESARMLYDSFCDSLSRLKSMRYGRYDAFVRRRRGGSKKASCRLMDRWCRLKICLLGEKYRKKMRSCSSAIPSDVAALESCFFDVLEGSKLYGGRRAGAARESGVKCALSDEERAEILARSPEDFMEDFEERYGGKVKRLETYGAKVERYSGEARELMLKMAKEQEGVLGPLSDSIRERERKRMKYSRRHRKGWRECRDARRSYRSVIELPLDKILGRYAVSVLYRSYLDARGDLEKEERRYRELRQSSGGEVSLGG